MGRVLPAAGGKETDGSHVAGVPPGTMETSSCCSCFSFLWFSLETCLPHACKTGQRCFVSCQRPTPVPSVLLTRSRLAQHGAYLEAPEPPDVPAPLEAGGYQPLIQAAFQGTEARGTSPNDGYSPGSHIPQRGGGRDAGEASPGGNTRSGGFRAWWVTPGERAVRLSSGWLFLRFLWTTDVSWAVTRLFLPDMIYWFPLLPCHTSCLRLLSPRGSLGSWA